MKKVVKFFGLTVGLFAAINASAQTGTVSGTRFGIGQDSLTCLTNLKSYQEDYNNRKYDAAIVGWRKVWRDCPLSSLNLTPHGAQIYKWHIDNERNPIRKKALVDTLINVWEKGIILRPQVKGQYQIQMMQDMIRYADTPENHPKLLSLQEEIMATQKEKTSALVFVNYMHIIFAQHKEGKLSDKELVDKYNRLNNAITEAIAKTTDRNRAEELTRARDQIYDTLANSSVKDDAAAPCFLAAARQGHTLSQFRLADYHYSLSQTTTSKSIRDASEKQALYWFENAVDDLLPLKKRDAEIKIIILKEKGVFYTGEDNF